MIITRKYLHALLVFLLISCDPSDFTLPSWQPDFVLPIVDVNLGIEHLILNTDGVKVSEDGLITISYRESESLGTLEELFPVEDLEVVFKVPAIPGNIKDFNIQHQIKLDALDLEEGNNIDIAPFNIDRSASIDISNYIREANCQTGRIEMYIQNDMPFVLKQGLRLSMFNQDLEEVIYDYTIPEDIEINQRIYLKDVDLKEVRILGNIRIDLKDLASDGANNVSLNETHGIGLGLNFKDVVLDRAILKFSALEYESKPMQLPFSIEHGALLTEASIDNALVELETKGYVQSGIVINIEIPHKNNSEEPIRIPLGKEKSSVPIKNFVLDLSANSTTQNTLTISTEVLTDSDGFVELVFNRSYDSKISFRSIDYGYLKGYLGTFKNVIQGDLKLDFLSNIQSGKIIFSDPRVNLNIKNSQGIIGSFYNDESGLFIRGRNDYLYPNEEAEVGESLYLSSFGGAESIGSFNNIDFVINNETEPSFNEFISLLPTDIEYRFPIKFGSSEPNLNQFIYDKGIIEYDLLVELPLELAAERLILTDTLLNNIQISYESVNLQRAKLTTTVENYYPLNLLVQNYYLDENYEIIDSLFSFKPDASAAKLNVHGKVVEPSISNFEVEVSEDRLMRIMEAKYYKPVIYMQTAGENKVKLLSEYTVNLKTVGKIELNIDLNK